MALRLLQAMVPEDLAELAETALREVEVQELWRASGGPFGAVVNAVIGAGRTGAAMDLLHERLSPVGGFRILVLPLHATLPRPHAAPNAGRREEARSAAAVSREEVYASIEDASKLSSTFVSLVVLATTVAAIGLAKNNAAAVIGAMVVAPLLGPNMGLALGLTLADGPLVRASARTSAAGVVLALAVAVVLGFVLSVDPSVPEIASRTRVDLADMLLALAAGCAGTLAYTTGAPAYLVGVMVAVALLPPTVAAGLLLAAGHGRDALGALLLVLANVSALHLAAMLTFLARGMRPRHWWEEQRARASARLGLLVLVGLFAALVGVVLLGPRLLDGTP